MCRSPPTYSQFIMLPAARGAQFYWSCLLRPKDTFAALAIATSSSFPMSSYSPATSDPGIEPVLVSEPLVLRRIPFALGRQYHPLSPRVGAVDTPPPRCFSADCTKLTKVRCHSTWLTSMSAHTSNLYRAVMQCARASARHNQLLTHAGPGPLGVSGESAHCGCTGTAHRCRRFYITNLMLRYRQERRKVMTCRTFSRLPHLWC